MIQIKALVLANEEVGPRQYKAVLACPEIADVAKPGQFVQIRCHDLYDPLLRRPMSICRATRPPIGVKTIEILYKVVGKGTTLLAQKKPGDYFDLLGPLGKGFTINVGFQTALIVSGGMGVASALALAETLKEKGCRVIALLGAQSKEWILLEEELHATSDELVVATDDGSYGHKGLVTELLSSLLRRMARERDFPQTRLYACGPKGMLKKVAQLAEEHHLPCQVSLEEYMACGVGACLSCVCKAKPSSLAPPGHFIYKLVCKDGPVFKAEEIIWDE